MVSLRERNFREYLLPVVDEMLRLRRTMREKAGGQNPREHLRGPGLGDLRLQVDLMLSVALLFPGNERERRQRKENPRESSKHKWTGSVGISCCEI